MSERSYFHVFTLGMFERELPKFDEPMCQLYVQLTHTDVTEARVRALVKGIMGENGVAIPEKYLEDAVLNGCEGGIFNVFIQTNYVDEFKANHNPKLIVKECKVCYPDLLTNAQLKAIFPEEFEGRFFCRECDFETEGEYDPCGNNSGTCSLGNMEYAKMAEVNQELQRTVDQMNNDLGQLVSGTVLDSVVEEAIFNVLEEQEEPSLPSTPPFYYVCPECGMLYDPRSTYVDDDGEIECTNRDCDDCWTYFNAEENKHEPV